MHSHSSKQQNRSLIHKSQNEDFSAVFRILWSNQEIGNQTRSTNTITKTIELTPCIYTDFALS